MAAPRLTRVALYPRAVRASLERVWENVRDWEHLPWLHHESFGSIARIDSGEWGWRARVGLQPAATREAIEIELRIDAPAERYVVRTLDGPGTGTAIWTRLHRVHPHRTDIEVEFLVPGVEGASARALGRVYTHLYTRLWNEDEAMMTRRETLLARRRDAAPAAAPVAPIDLGDLEALRAQLPRLVETSAGPVRIVEVEGELVAHAATCPHWLGPLDTCPVEAGGTVVCPWHGYRFDLATGRSADGRGLRLAPSLEVEVDPETSRVRLVPGAWRERRRAQVA